VDCGSGAPACASCTFSSDSLCRPIRVLDLGCIRFWLCSPCVFCCRLPLKHQACQLLWIVVISLGFRGGSAWACKNNWPQRGHHSRSPIWPASCRATSLCFSATSALAAVLDVPRAGTHPDPDLSNSAGRPCTAGASTRRACERKQGTLARASIVRTIEKVNHGHNPPHGQVPGGQSTSANVCPVSRLRDSAFGKPAAPNGQSLRRPRNR